MAHSKIDGVIEAVRYTPNGKISMVRSYQRRGAAWSDHVLLTRPELIQQLKNGKRYVTGTRKKDLGGVFEMGASVRLADDHISTESQASVREFLAGVPLF
jgi:hypothetical protein